ncbi:flagella synthesis protein FlgN [Teredinibacter franksiae]|uniref:flagella synthesis protein FlgN n=1 Tax=Teredinibacter franksiae TaxID=2761453 RepID=UPI001624FF3A|nr:flagellar protein FlgN [Teredinibacter franksiae]
MSGQISPQQLTQQLQSDILACETLLGLLEKEKTALSSRDVDAMDGIIEQKAEQLTSLEASAQQRSQWSRDYLGQSGSDLEALKQAWANMLTSTGTPQLVEQWQKLKDLQIACKQANEVNGKILARNQKTFGRLLEIVRGQTAAPNLYSAAGKSTSGHISQKVGEA